MHTFAIYKNILWHKVPGQLAFILNCCTCTQQAAGWKKSVVRALCIFITYILYIQYNTVYLFSTSLVVKPKNRSFLYVIFRLSCLGDFSLVRLLLLPRRVRRPPLLSFYSASSYQVFFVFLTSSSHIFAFLPGQGNSHCCSRLGWILVTRRVRNPVLRISPGVCLTAIVISDSPICFRSRASFVSLSLSLFSFFPQTWSITPSRT